MVIFSIRSSREAKSPRRSMAAHQLAIAERTVHKHLERIYKKLGVCDRVSAVRRAHRLGLQPSWAREVAFR